MTKNGTWKVIAVVGGFIVIIIGAAVTYGMLTKDVEYAVEEVVKLEDEVKAMQPKVEKNTNRHDVIDRDLYYIQQDIADIKTGVDTIIKKMNDES